MPDANGQPSAGSLRVGSRIANSRGVLGTLGCFALSLEDRRPLLLTSEHVLFGGGGREGEPVWMAEAESRQRAGTTRHGRRGLVRYGGHEVHLDCASAELDPDIARTLDLQPEPAGDMVEREQPVQTVGHTTGAVRGTVFESDYQGVARIAGRDFQTRGQILVRPEKPGMAFNAAGDSGAALRTADGKIVGIVWGATPAGEGLACPIAPVLWVLHLELARPVANGVNR
jgi:hypothetical protein